MLTMNQKDIAIIHKLAPKHYTSENAPNSYKALKEWYTYNNSSVDNIPVYDGGCDNTIYGSNKANNYAFRAWHDSIHIKHNLDFSFKGEIKTAKIQVKEAIANGMSKKGAKLLWLDIYGQVMYYYYHKQYVNNQVKFINLCLKDGVFNTVINNKGI